MPDIDNDQLEYVAAKLDTQDDARRDIGKRSPGALRTGSDDGRPIER